MLVSFVARGAESTRMPDREFRRSITIEAERLTLRPPRPAILEMLDLSGRLAGRAPEAAPLMHWIRKADLARENIGPSASAAPLFFLDDAALLPPHRLEPALTLERAAQALINRLARFDGRTLDFNAGGGSGDASSRGASPQVLTRSRPDGATPGIARAIALASVTPAPLEPEIVAAASMRLPALAGLPHDGAGKPVLSGKLAIGPGYMDLIDPDLLKREQKCLAEAVYFEARSEPEAGQAAVAQVVLNRVRSGHYPASICGVVYQNRHRFKACQFTFTCEGRSLAILEPASWATAQKIAGDVLAGQVYLPEIGAATHYHANYVAPYWSRRLKRQDQIGRHIFYALRPGQT